jgi:hypothetical protein
VGKDTLERTLRLAAAQAEQLADAYGPHFDRLFASEITPVQKATILLLWAEVARAARASESN